MFAVLSAEKSFIFSRLRMLDLLKLVCYGKQEYVLPHPSTNNPLWINNWEGNDIHISIFSCFTSTIVQ